jgi:nitroimidazol reductase NimA-like FMN-containing flavoprotein (pyridoxamine 5'-phosphate oxidase superfamily)
MAYVKRDALQMSNEEIDAFLASSQWGRLGTVSADGEPHVAPIGFHLHGGRLYFHGLLRSRRSRDLEAEERVSLCVDDGVGPDAGYGQRRGVIVYGRCRQLGDDDRDLVVALRPGYAERFFGDREKNFERRTHAWFEITPYRFASWDFGKIPTGADRMTATRTDRT